MKKLSFSQKWTSNLVSIVVVFGLFTMQLPTHAAETELSTQPYELLTSVANKTLIKIKSNKQEDSLNDNAVRDIIEQELMPFIDYKFAAFKVLGANVKKASRDELNEFVEAFRMDLVESYSLALSGLDDHAIEFENKTVGVNDKYVSFKSLVKGGKGPPINIIFKLRKSGKQSTWKVYDLEAEGISLISSKQSEFAPIIRKQGIAALIDILETKVG